MHRNYPHRCFPYHFPTPIIYKHVLKTAGPRVPFIFIIFLSLRKTEFPHLIWSRDSWADIFSFNCPLDMIVLFIKGSWIESIMSYFIVSRTNILLHNRVVCLGCYLISFEIWVKFSVPPTTKGKECACVGGGRKFFARCPLKRYILLLHHECWLCYWESKMKLHVNFLCELYK